MIEARSPLALAQAWTDAIEAGDRNRIDELLSGDLIVWRNVTREIQPRGEFLELAAELSRQLPGFHYADVTRVAFEGGFVQQHVVTGSGRSGRPFEAPACIVCRVCDGRISRFEEYYDSAHDPR